MKKTIALWLLRIVPAIILLQTLYFKFSAQPESVYIFTKVGIEPWGRIGSGIAELIAGILLLVPRTTLIGAIIGVGVMAGAIASHIFILGLVIMDDGGQLFAYALITCICCLAIIGIQRRQIPQLLKLKF